NFPLTLKEFKIEAVSGGSDAQGDASVLLEEPNSSRAYRGRATSTDVFEAALKALIDAINRVQRAHSNL
ncbi:MAG: hypothetical protein J6X44_08165, partial [Thermoguttaceae bacterium]|nr:hypothetical protein [Thermoguttaceae bacterium]